MASGRDLKRRITSVKSTQQITKAMKMVSAARLRRAQDAIVRARPYAHAIKDVVQNLATVEGLAEIHPLLARRNVKKVNVVLLTSDRGLCGSFNSSLIKRAETLYKTESSKYESIVFTTIGKRGYEYLKLRKIPVAKNYADFFRGLNYAKSQAMADELLEDFLSGEYDEIRVIYAEFKSAIAQIVRQETLLPIQVEEGAAKTSADFVFEPNASAVLESLLPRYFRAKIYKSILESQASEYGARMAAMDNATKNAGEMIRKLTLEFNKARQASITKELLEIISGAEALK